LVASGAMVALLLAATLFTVADDAQTASASPYAITESHSGLVASDPLNNETESQSQVLNDTHYWSYNGTVYEKQTPFYIYKDSEGLHIGEPGPNDSNFYAGSYSGFAASSPPTNAELVHTIITQTNQSVAQYDFQSMLEVDSSGADVNYLTCAAVTDSSGTYWTVVHGYGDSTEADTFDTLYTSTYSSLPLTGDCTLVTNGSNFIQVYLNGNLVYSSSALSLGMDEPFVYDLMTMNADQFVTHYGVFSDYYATSSGNITVTGVPAGSTVKLLGSGGDVLASSAVSSGSATLNVAMYDLPVSGTLDVYDSSGSLLASVQVDAYGGDIYQLSQSSTSSSVSGSTSTLSTSTTTTTTTTSTPQTGGVVVGGARSTSGTVSSSPYQITLPSFPSGSGDDRLLVVGVSADNDSVASVTFGGIPLTEAVASFNNNDAEFWYLTDPIGSANIVVTMTGPTQVVVGAYSLSGVNQADPIPAQAAAHNTSPGSPAVSIAAKYANDLVLDLPSIYGQATLSSPSCTQRWNVNLAGQITGASSSAKVSSPGTVTCAWTASGGGDLWDDVGIEVMASATSASSSTSTSIATSMSTSATDTTSATSTTSATTSTVSTTSTASSSSTSGCLPILGCL
jgi:hypothetical protein